MDSPIIVPTNAGGYVSIPAKSAESRLRVSKRKRIRNAKERHNVAGNRRDYVTNGFFPDNAMSEDIPTSGNGWTLR